MSKVVEDAMKAGYLLATEGCLPSAAGARVRSTNGNLTVTDGPFTDSKEAAESARQFLLVAGDGECELRQIFEADAAVCAAPRA